MFSSSASAPACSICFAYFVQPPKVEPLMLPMIGILTAAFASRCARDMLRPDPEFCGLRKVAQRFGKAFRPCSR